MVSFKFVKPNFWRKLFGAKPRSNNIKDLRRVLDGSKLEIEAVGRHDPRLLAIPVSKNIAASWILYDTRGRKDTEFLNCLTELGRRAITQWSMVMREDGLEGVDGMIYRALCLILVEAYLERYLSSDDKYWMKQALELYARVLQDDPGGDDDDEQMLDADDFTYDDTTTGGCVSDEARKTNLDMARLIHAEEFGRLRVRDVGKEVREGSGSIRLKSNADL